MLPEQLTSLSPCHLKNTYSHPKARGMRAVSSTPTVGFADHFCTAMIWDSLACPPGTLQPQVVLFTRGCAAPSSKPRDS